MVQIRVYLVGGRSCPSWELASVLTRYSPAFAHLGSGKLASQQLRRERDERLSWCEARHRRDGRAARHAGAEAQTLARVRSFTGARSPRRGAAPWPGPHLAAERRRAPPAPPGPAVPSGAAPRSPLCGRRLGPPAGGAGAGHRSAPPLPPTIPSPTLSGPRLNRGEPAPSFPACLPPVPRLAELRRLPSPALSLPPTARPPPLRRCPPEPPTSPWARVAAASPCHEPPLVAAAAAALSGERGAMPGWKKNIPICLQAEPERGERGAPGRQPPAAREGRRAGGPGSAAPPGAPSSAHAGLGRSRPAVGRAAGPAPSILLRRRGCSGGCGGRHRAGGHTGPAPAASVPTLLLSAVLPPALHRAGLLQPGGREPEGWEGGSEVTSRNFSVCGFAPGRCRTCPVPPGERRWTGTIAPRRRAVAAVAAPSPGSSPGMASGPRTPPYGSVMSEPKGSLVALKNKLSVIIKMCLCPFLREGFCHGGLFCPLLLLQPVGQRQKRLGHHLVLDMPVELCLWFTGQFRGSMWSPEAGHLGSVAAVLDSWLSC